jgi:hypothetical protein
MPLGRTCHHHIRPSKTKQASAASCLALVERLQVRHKQKHTTATTTHPSQHNRVPTKQRILLTMQFEPPVDSLIAPVTGGACTAVAVTGVEWDSGRSASAHVHTLPARQQSEHTVALAPCCPPVTLLSTECTPASTGMPAAPFCTLHINQAPRIELGVLRDQHKRTRDAKQVQESQPCTTVHTK